MRIVHVCEYFYPMYGYQETCLPREHMRMGHDVYVVTGDRYRVRSYKNMTARKVLGDRIKGSGFFIEDGFNVHQLKPLFTVPPGKMWWVGLEDTIQRLKPDLVIVHGIVDFSAIRIARLKKKLGNFKLIYDDHMSFQASRHRSRILYPLFKRNFSHLIQETADALVGVADVSKVFMHKKYDIPLERITVIPLGADDGLFRFDEAARKEVRDELSLDEGDIIFIYTGAMSFSKGPHLLVRAAIELMKRYDGLKVVLVGDGLLTYIDKMKLEIQSEGMEDRFVWHEAVPNRELYKYYSAADIAVWPREASLSMVEAMACGLPVIISDTSEVTERVGWDNGLTYTGDDPVDLARQMEKLLDPDLRKRMGTNGRNVVEERLSWTVIARQFLELVE